jgi:hypothetical protein
MYFRLDPILGIAFQIPIDVMHLVLVLCEMAVFSVEFAVDIGCRIW